tara:strand:+ start:1088 stop:2887 length:1800 start_codon:yes stop_codon:yes gene_type:complete
MRENNKTKFEKINRRIFLFIIFKFFSVFYIIERLYNLQIRQSEKFKKLAENNRINSMFIIPARGIIYDRNKFILADNVEQYQLIYRYTNTKDKYDHLVQIFKYLKLEQNKKENLLKEISFIKKDFVQIIIKNDLTWNEVARISSNITELRGVFIEMILRRSYNSFSSSHVVGYVKAPDKKEYPKLANVPGTVVGKIGIEKSYDKRLQGKFGIKKEEVNAHGRVVKEISRLNGIPGEDINISISRDLQDFCYERLGDNSGSIVVLDVRSGELLSMVSKPSFNSNDFISAMSQEKWDNIINNELNPMFNRSSQGTYPPGSIFKIIVSITALNEKNFNPDKKYFCNGGYKFGNQIFHCWKEGGHGFIDCKEAITMSCDCYFYDLSLNLGIEKISETAKVFGLGEKYLNEIFPASEGIIPNKKWKKNKFQSEWTKSDTIVASIGQGFALSSPLQLAVMIARVCTNGDLVKPKIIKNEGLNEQPKKIPLVEEKIFSYVKQGMFNTVNNINGTAYNSRKIKSNYFMAGKTATSQVRRISMREREEGIIKNEELPRKMRDHALFVGYFPHDKPKFAFSVVVEHGGSGSKTAAPIAQDICKKLVKKI